jgi:hypothetical protein
MQAGSPNPAFCQPGYFMPDPSKAWDTERTEFRPQRTRSKHLVCPVLSVSGVSALWGKKIRDMSVKYAGWCDSLQPAGFGDPALHPVRLQSPTIN